MWENICVLALIAGLAFAFSVLGDFDRHYMPDEWKDLQLDQKVELHGILETVTMNSGNLRYCVDIYKQPAFENPLLKNHVLQFKPTTIPKELNNIVLFKGANTSISNSGYSTCPPGTIPIHKTNTKNFTSSTPNIQNNILRYRYAILRMIHFADDMFHGALTNMKLDNPHVGSGQSSGGSIWIASDHSDQKNLIKAGWMVYPDIYGDTYTHLSVDWTSDGFHKIGCYDILCPGFIQVDNEMVVGTTLVTKNVHESSHWSDMYFYIFQDILTKHWWLVTNNVVESKITYIGYWPKEIFTRFSQGATVLDFGGYAMASVGQQFPLMGDGYFPDGREKYSNYFENIRYVNKSNYLVPPCNLGTELHTDSPSCYNVMYEETHDDIKGGDRFLFMGGPGGKCES